MNVAIVFFIGAVYLAFNVLRMKSWDRTIRGFWNNNGKTFFFLFFFGGVFIEIGVMVAYFAIHGARRIAQRMM